MMLAAWKAVENTKKETAMPKFQIEVPLVATRIYYLEEEGVNTLEEAMEAYLSAL